ncbi:MAG: MarR family winged helix-turn-helix transcriptional regulator [Lysobacterales bacterium]
MSDVLDLEHFLPYRLSVLSNRISASISRLYAERFALGMTEWRVMAVIGLSPGLSSSEVVERTAMDKVAVSRAVDRLLRSGRLLREIDQADRRRGLLRLSEAGRAVYDEVVPAALALERRLLDGIPAAGRSQLDQLLQQLDTSAAALQEPN